MNTGSLCFAFLRICSPFVNSTYRHPWLQTWAHKMTSEWKLVLSFSLVRATQLRINIVCTLFQTRFPGNWIIPFCKEQQLLSRDALWRWWVHSVFQIICFWKCVFVMLCSYVNSATKNAILANRLTNLFFLVRRLFVSQMPPFYTPQDAFLADDFFFFRWFSFFNGMRFTKLSLIAKMLRL